MKQPLTKAFIFLYDRHDNKIDNIITFETSYYKIISIPIKKFYKNSLTFQEILKDIFIIEICILLHSEVTFDNTYILQDYDKKDTNYLFETINNLNIMAKKTILCFSCNSIYIHNYLEKFTKGSRLISITTFNNYTTLDQKLLFNKIINEIKTVKNITLYLLVYISKQSLIKKLNYINNIYYSKINKKNQYKMYNIYNYIKSTDVSYLLKNHYNRNMFLLNETKEYLPNVKKILKKYTKYYNTKQKMFIIIDSFKKVINLSYKKIIRSSNKNSDYYYIINMFISKTIIKDFNKHPNILLYLMEYTTRYELNIKMISNIYLEILILNNREKKTY